MDLIRSEEHKELHKRIYDCDCKPWRNETDYCERCQGHVIAFMDQFGAGVLTRDELVKNLQEAFNTAMIEVGTLKQKLEGKIKRVENLKKDGKDLQGAYNIAMKEIARLRKLLGYGSESVQGVLK